MKHILLILFSIFMTSISFADVFCKVEAGWGIQFTSGNSPTFVEARQVLANGEKSVSTIEIQQAYMSPSEFKARALFDGQKVNIRTQLSSRNGEFAIYTGTMNINSNLQIVTCNQN